MQQSNKQPQSPSDRRKTGKTAITRTAGGMGDQTRSSSVQKSLDSQSPEARAAAISKLESKGLTAPTVASGYSANIENSLAKMSPEKRAAAEIKLAEGGYAP